MNSRLFLTITIIFGSMTPSFFHALEQDPFMCKVPRGEHEKAHKQNTLVEESHKKEQFNFVCTDSYEITKSKIVEGVAREIIPTRLYHMESSSGKDLFALTSRIRDNYDSYAYAIDPELKRWQEVQTMAYGYNTSKSKLLFLTMDNPARNGYWDSNQDCTRPLPILGKPTAIESDAQGRSLCSIICFNGEIVIVDLQTKEIVNKIAYEEIPVRVTLKKLHNDTMMYAINQRNGSIETGILDSDQMQTLPPGELIYLYEDKERRTTIIGKTRGVAGRVYLRDVATGVMCGELSDRGTVYAIAVKEIEGSILVATVNELDVITLWDVTNRNVPNKITSFKPVSDAAKTSVLGIELYQDALGHICIAFVGRDYAATKFVYRNVLSIWKPAVRKTRIETIKKELPKLPDPLQNMVLEYAGAREYALQNDGDQERPTLPESSIGESDLLEGKLKKPEIFLEQEPLPIMPVKNRMYTAVSLGIVTGALTFLASYGIKALWLKYKNR